MKTSWRFCVAALGLSIGACSDDALETQQVDDRVRVDASFALLDSGQASIDTGSGATRTCEQADARYTIAIENDLTLKQLASCTVEADCVLWSPTIRCANGAYDSQCPRATHVTNLLQAEARRDALAAGTYCAPGEPVCHGGASCPQFAARCMQGTCAAQIEWPDAGR